MDAKKQSRMPGLLRQATDARNHPQHDERAAPLLLTVEQAAQRLNVGRSTLYLLLQSGRLESVTVGRLRRVPTSALASFIESLRGRC
jgi:excisionase family DNA binding protein